MKLPYYNEQTICLIELTLCAGIGPVMGRYLLQYFGTPEAIFRSSIAGLQEISGLRSNQIQSIINGANCAQAKAIMLQHESLNILCITLLDTAYPYRLREFADAPLVLFYKGQLEWNAKRVIGVVGTRKPTPAGRAMVVQMIADLQETDVVVVSGMAYGIDVIAHETAVDCKIPTWAVLANGLEKIYPSAHQAFAKKMLAEKGGLISEFPAYTVINPNFFPRRNRIVAGLCDALLIIESGIRGGSMITASIAHGYSRDVFAIPGRPIDKNAEGCNFLIQKNMASLCVSAQDIVERMNWDLFEKFAKPEIDNRRESAEVDRGNTLPPPKKTLKQVELFESLSPTEKQVMEWIVSGNDNTNTMVRQQKCSSTAISVALLELELKGLIAAVPGNQYQIISAFYP